MQLGIGRSVMATSDSSGFREIRSYAGQVQRLASALSEDAEFARRLIDAVHSGSSAEVERIFSGLDVGTDVRIATLDETEAGTAGGAGPGSPEPGQTARAAQKTKIKTITVTIGIGPFSISVTVKKESK